MAILLALLLATEISQADIEAYAVRSRAERPSAIASLKKSVVRIRRDRSIGKVEKRLAIERTQKRIAELSRRGTPYYAPLVHNFAAPELDKIAIGYLRARSFSVVQVIDEQNAVVQYHWTTTYVEPWQGADDPVARGVRGNTRKYWLSGVSTKTYADGDTIELRGIFAVRGTKTYETVGGGSNTVPVIEAVDLSAQESLFKGP